ncbi:DUF4269 domain-containing protein [Paenibacillus piri]|uniref:DUF4269 domain-containing protein n=1 Tax=Paenibacillus piri TaxID=2547395 RepID=A0A4R5KK28_9BACL|nr:DUF4269 domain-containing protein [Paenibacillus piri]TDF95891.1 DUF4269 domain-containing protein [Paenibacillus piri]
MLKSIAYLQTGNERQRRAYKAIVDLGILNDLARYGPVLCGTIPIGIDVDGSDLDIIMKVEDFAKFTAIATRLYGNHTGFQVKSNIIREMPAIKVNFDFGGFPFELFGQPQPVEAQHAYRHMLVEHRLLMKYPDLKNDVIRLKEQGIKTEPAFARILQLAGDPYDSLLTLGEAIRVSSRSGPSSR